MCHSVNCNNISFDSSHRLDIVVFQFVVLSKQVSKQVNKVVIYIYLNNHLQVKVRWDFNKKSTTRLVTKSSIPNLALILDTFLKLLIKSYCKTSW